MSDLTAAIHDARIDTDDRGLMPLTDARARVAALDVYRKGEGQMVGGTFVLESDRAWAALLSLGDVEEFVREATRIRFEFHVRGMDNVAPVERYGAGVLPWIAAAVDARGVLANVPWCLLPCLVAIDGEAAFELAMRIRGVVQDLRQGPGAYAADSPGDVERSGQLAAEDRSVARRWLAARVDRMALLEARAARGDADARALLAELRPPLAPKVAQLLAEAETLDVAPGPAVSILELDEQARDYLFPIWDNTNYTCGGMRITGLVSPAGDALVLQMLTHNPGAGDGYVREITAYGPGVTKRSRTDQVVSGGQLVEWLDGDSTLLSRVTGVIMRGETIGGKRKRFIVTPPGGIHPTVRLQVGSASINLWTTFPDIPKLDATKRRCARAIDPACVPLFHLAEPGLRDKVFLAPDAVGAAVGAPPDAEVLFSFDDWEHPSAGEEASSSIDLVTMVAALGRRAKLTRLLGRANGRFHHWLEHLAQHRNDPEAWGEGNPIDEGAKTSGLSIDPRHDLLMARGWPHLVSFVHDHPWNEPKKAAETAAQILRDGFSMFRVTWAREVAFRTARALGASDAGIDPKDRAVKKALGVGGPIGSVEAKEGLTRLVGRKVKTPPALVEDHVLLLEACIGPTIVVDATLAALGKVSAKKVPPNAAAALHALGFVLARAPAKSAAKARAKLAALAEKLGQGELAQLALLLSGKRKGKIPEAWLVHVLDDPAYVRKAVAAAKGPLDVDVRLVTLAEPEILDNWRPRLALLSTSPEWAVVQLGMLADRRAGELLQAMIDAGLAVESARTWLGYRKR